MDGMARNKSKIVLKNVRRKYFIFIQLISCIQDIKLNNCERKKRWEWEKIQAKLYKLSIKSLTLNQIQDVGSIFIEQTKNILISFFAAKYVIYGEMTLGMMMSTQYIIGQMNAPLLSFISFFQKRIVVPKTQIPSCNLLRDS